MNIKNIFDQYNDKGQYLLVKILNNLESDGIIKVASELEDITKLASDKFAWADFRKFPINSQDNAILSKLYFDNQRDKIPTIYQTKIAAKLNTYLDLYNVPDSIFEIKKVEQVKTASDPRFLLPKYNLCKVADCSDLDRANTVFKTEYIKLKVSDRVEFAKNFMKCASDFDFKNTPSSQIIKYAAILDTDMGEVKDLLNIRVAAANRSGKSGIEYKKLASMLDEVVKTSKEELEKLAEVIDIIDQEYGFDHPKYDKIMPDAYGVVFNKKAMDLAEDVENSAATMTKADIVGRYGTGILEEVENADGTINVDRLNNITKKLNIPGSTK